MSASGDRLTCLVTGAASGIGAAIARRLAAPGRTVLLHTRSNAGRLEDTAENVRTSGAEVVTRLGDLADPQTVRSLAVAVADNGGRLDVLVSNAGFANRRPFGELTEHEVVEAVNAMQLAFFRLATACLPFLRAAPHGRVVAVSSFGAHRFRAGGRPFPASASAKAGMEALARSLAAQVAGDSITVNCVVPGFIRKDAGAHASLSATDWDRVGETIPAGRLGTPDDVAAVIGFLVSPEAGYVTGQLIHVDGGLTL